MKMLTRTTLVVILTASLVIGLSAAPLPGSSPEAQGVSCQALVQFVDALDHIDGLHGVMVVRHGHVIAGGWWQPYDAAHQHVLFSLSKSFTSSAVGFAVAEGKLKIDDHVLKFFPTDAPAKPSENLKAMRVRDLLTMSAGHQDESPVAPNEISPKAFLAQPVPYAPGTHFKYNTPATFMLSAIVQKVTGQTVLDYLRPRLFEPLEIENPVWDTNFQGISLGGYGLRVHTEDIAKFGQFYLQHGSWHGKQLLPESWVTMATTKQIANGSNPNSDWNQGYCFQFWRCRHNAFRGDGAFGQYCVVMPDQDAVVAINSGVKDMQAVLNVIWDKLLPQMQSEPLPPDQIGDLMLMARLKQLEISLPKGSRTPEEAGGFLRKIYTFPENDQKLERLALTTADSGNTLNLAIRLDGKNVVIPCGFRNWKKSHAPLDAGKLVHYPDEPMAGTFAWPDDNTCNIKLCAVETPFHEMFTLKFDGDRVTLDTELNVSFEATKRPRLTGTAD